jgi:hypothetical protein
MLALVGRSYAMQTFSRHGAGSVAPARRRPSYSPATRHRAAPFAARSPPFAKRVKGVKSLKACACTPLGCHVACQEACRIGRTGRVTTITG